MLWLKKSRHFLVNCTKISVMILDYLSQHVTINETIKAFFEKECVREFYEEGSEISGCGQFNRKIYFVEEGLTRTFYYEKGKDITSNFYTEGKIMALIDTIYNGEPSRYGIQVIEKSVIVSCEYHKLEATLNVSKEYSEFSRFVLGKLMTQMLERIASLQYMTAKEKYSHLMEKNPSIILRAPLGMVASYLGITQETLSRIRSNG